jgi:hypothetical protein
LKVRTLLIDYRKDVAVGVFEPHAADLTHGVDVAFSRRPGQVVVLLEGDALSAQVIDNGIEAGARRSPRDGPAPPASARRGTF